MTSSNNILHILASAAMAIQMSSLWHTFIMA
jgi:hypothetical protein